MKKPTHPGACVLRVLLIALLGAAAFAAGGTATVTGADETAIKIVTLGDSITKGVRQGVADDETFSSRLQAALSSQSVAASVVNQGIGGERTDQALARLTKDIIALSPHIVTIMYGTNDSYVDKGKRDSRLTADEYRKNLKLLVERLRAEGIEPILMTEPRWSADAKDNGVGEHPNLRLSQFMKACRQVAKSQDTRLVDHFDHWTQREQSGVELATWTTDTVHPNPRGHEEIAATMLPVVLEVVKTVQNVGRTDP